MRLRHALLLLLIALAGCDRISGVSEQKSFDAEAIGYACRVSLKKPEDCMKENEAYSPTSILTGWKNADKDIVGKVLDPSMGQITAAAIGAPAASAPGAPVVAEPSPRSDETPTAKIAEKSNSSTKKPDHTKILEKKPDHTRTTEKNLITPKPLGKN